MSITSPGRIRVRSLFVKIFLWFWLANALVVGSLVLATIGVPSGRGHDNMKAIAGHTVALDTEKAIATLNGEGPEALRRQLNQLDNDLGLRLFLYNEQGEELLARTPPDRIRDLALLAGRSGEAQLDRSHGFIPTVAISVLGPDGRHYAAAGQYSKGPWDSMAAAPQILLMRVAAVLLMAGMVCYGLARHLTRPIRTLRASARQLAAGDLATRVGPAIQKRYDEIADLGRDFDFMAERIDLLVSAQRRLLRDMSHELRSPLARLRVALELVRRQTGPEVGGLLDRTERETRRLNELIGAILTVARLEGGEVKSEQTCIDLAALVQEVVADADFEARSRGRQVSLLCDEGCAVIGTHEFLRSAIENVVRNAVRYTAEGTQVEIALTREERGGEAQTVIRVRDHGPGVPDHSLQDIFQPFYRVDDDRDRQTGGTGLGLAIAQQAMRLHGGTISAANAPGGGLLVELTLPAATESPGHCRPSPGTEHRLA